MRNYGTLALFVFLFVGCAPPATEQPAAPVVSNDSQLDWTTDTDTISILAWNVESGGNDPEVIAEQLKELSRPIVYGGWWGLGSVRGGA